VIVLYQTGVDIENQKFIAAVEVKTRVSDTTIGASHNLAEKFSKVCFLELSEVTNESNLSTWSNCYKEVIPKSDDRRQCFHHVAALQLQHVLYAEATESGITRVVIVKFPLQIIQKYRSMLKELKDNHLNWIYGNDNIPEFNEHDLGHVGDNHTLCQTLDVWKAAVQYFHSNGNEPFPAIERIIPLAQLEL
jgi:adenine-specific DNA methylase